MASLVTIATLFFSYMQQTSFQDAAHAQELKIQKLKQSHEKEIVNIKSQCAESKSIISDLADMLYKKDNLDSLSDSKRGSFFKAYSYLTEEESTQITAKPKDFEFAVTLMVYKVSKTYKECYVVK